MPRLRLGALGWLLAAPLFLAAQAHTALPTWVGPTGGRGQLCRLCPAQLPVVLIATGALLALGTLLTWAELGPGVATRITQLLLLTAAAGYLLAGARPGDVGVALVTVVGNLALVVAALARRSGVLGPMRAASLVLGCTGLAGVLLLAVGVEVDTAGRLAGYPLLIWALAVGLRLLPALAAPGDRPAR
jgi:hypothetical protein